MYRFRRLLIIVCRKYLETKQYKLQVVRSRSKYKFESNQRSLNNPTYLRVQNQLATQLLCYISEYVVYSTRSSLQKNALTLNGFASKQTCIPIFNKTITSQFSNQNCNKLKNKFLSKVQYIIKFPKYIHATLERLMTSIKIMSQFHGPVKYKTHFIKTSNSLSRRSMLLGAVL